MGIAVVSCGGGSSSPTTQTPTTQTPTTYSATYFDAPVKGVHYTNSPSNLSGDTDSSGSFQFQAGDTVNFSIPTTGTPISLGSIAPTTPSSASQSLIVPVVSLSNGGQLLQILQTLGGTGPVIDVTGKGNTLSTQDISTVNMFISSGGATTAPTTLNSTPLVSSDVALKHALDSLTTLTAQPIDSSRKYDVAFYSGIVTVTPQVGQVITFSDKGLSYRQPSGSWGKLCANLPFITPNILGPTGWCFTVGIDLASGTWTSPADNQIIFSGPQSNPFTLKDTILFQGSQSGAYSWTLTFPNNTSNFVGSGTWTILQPEFSKATLASKTIKVSGNDSCTDGFSTLIFDSTGGTYQVSCSTARKDNGQNSPVPGVVSLSSMPGILTFTDSGTTAYVGLAVGSTISSGTLAVVIQGSKDTCGSGPGYSLKSCGFAQLVSVTSN